MSDKSYENCHLCARNCGVDRRYTRGFCKMSDSPTVARAALHFWEEPPISGTRGSGTVFFSGCSLSCIYCQNNAISRGESGRVISVDRLAEIMISLERDGAHNINLVTPTHFIPSIREAIVTARKRGLTLPIVYNTGSYDSVDALRTLDGLVDVYLPDLKYFRPDTAAALSLAGDYPTVARSAIAEMVRQTGPAVIDSDGIMLRGTIVRILLLPGHVAEAKLSLKYLYDTYGDSIYISLMNQYTPMPGMHQPLDRAVTREEYRQLTDYASRLGITGAFVQEAGTAAESFIPPFDYTGI